ncbi:MAG TPA: hypothetical protein VES19_05900 [Candidatus Limnocylindrales bacterium]|nr:hypothetical protein [Candidatus Limnocylindrales bacterium]
MRAAGDAPATLAVAGDYHGRRTVKVSNEAVTVEVLAEAGPRLVRLRREGLPGNLLAETPDLGWDTALGRYELLGGHRLWFAPEVPDRVAVPDSSGLVLETLDDGLRMTGAEEPVTGLVRSIELRLHPSMPAMSLLHRVENRGPQSLDLAPWAITQLPLGGAALIPQRRAAAGHLPRPNRNLVLWPYSSWDDPRLHVRDGLIVVDAVAGPDLKVGCLDDTGWVAYVRDGVALVRRFEPAPDQPHADLGCNIEAFCGSRYLELEILGPMRTLAPGTSATLLERWEVRHAPADGAMLQRAVLDRPMDAHAA